jgi:CheY-like chemotaxis protein
MPESAFGSRATAKLVTALKSTGDVASKTVELTRGATARTLRGVGGGAATSRVVSQAVLSAVRAGSKAGVEIGAVVQGAVTGAIQGVEDVTKITPGLLRDTTRSVVAGVKEAGGDVVEAATKSVEAAIEAGKAAGMSAEEAASASAAGAVSAAAEISEALGNAVAKALSRTIEGVRLVVEAPSRKPTILVASGNLQNLESLSRQLRKEGYRVQPVSTSTQMDDAIEPDEQRPRLAIVDLSDFGEAIWDNCEHLRRARIPFIIISPRRSADVQRESICHGAAGVLTKPIGTKEIVDHIRGVIGS